jgi:hypothetical protein
MCKRAVAGQTVPTTWTAIFLYIFLGFAGTGIIGLQIALHSMNSRPHIESRDARQWGPIDAPQMVQFNGRAGAIEPDVSLISLCSKDGTCVYVPVVKLHSIHVGPGMTVETTQTEHRFRPAPAPAPAASPSCAARGAVADALARVCAAPPADP